MLVRKLFVEEVAVNHKMFLLHIKLIVEVMVMMRDLALNFM